MGRARSAIAARTDVEALLKAALEAFAVEVYETEHHTEFFDVAQFCRQHSEELGGENDSDGWYLWQVGPWAILGDLSLLLLKEDEALEALSEHLGDSLVAAGCDVAFEYAYFGYVEGGAFVRKILLEDDTLEEEGLPLKIERGHNLDNFGEDEVDYLWQSYKLPTFAHDPLDSDFKCVAVRRR